MIEFNLYLFFIGITLCLFDGLETIESRAIIYLRIRFFVWHFQYEKLWDKKTKKFMDGFIKNGFGRRK